MKTTVTVTRTHELRAERVIVRMTRILRYEFPDMSYEDRLALATRLFEGATR